MSRLRIDPQDYGKIYADSTFEVEGYEEHLDQIRKEYPEETKTDEQRLAEQIFDPESEMNQNLPETDWTGEETITGQEYEDFEGSMELPSEQIFQHPIKETTGDAPDPRFSDQPNTALRHSDGTPFREEVINQLNLRANNSQFDPRETDITRRLASTNLEESLGAFKEIQADQRLIDIYDFNHDGKFSYADMVDHNNWNGGKGMTAAQDEELTKAWFNGVQNKDFGTRFKFLLQQINPTLAGDTDGLLLKIPYYTEARRMRLVPTNELDRWENTDENILGGWTKWVKMGLDTPEQLFSWMTGGQFGGYDAKLGAHVLGTERVGSMAFLQNNPARRKWGDGTALELGFWIPEGLGIAVTLGTTSVGLARYAPKLKHGKGVAMAVSRMINPISITHKSFKAGQWVSPTGPWRHAIGLKNWGLTATKAGFLETYRASMAMDLSIDGMGQLYNDNGIARRIIDGSPDSWWFGTELQWAIESPLGRRYANWMEEAKNDSIGAAMLGGVFRGMQGGYKFGQKTLNNFRTSTGNSWPTWQGTVRDGKYWWQVQQKKDTDLLRAGQEQIEAGLDPTNAMARTDGTKVQNANGKGLYKNPQASNNPLEGTIPRRETAVEIQNAAEVIDNNIIQKPGSTGAVLDIVDLAKTAKNGLPNDVSEKLTKEFVESPTLAAQLKSLDPASRTVGGWGETALKRVQEVLGRDAASLSPREFWGDVLLNSPIKVGDLKALDEAQRFVAEQLFVADSVNVSLLTQLRDLAAATSEAVGKQDIFARDSAMQRIEANLIAGLSNVKKTRAVWSTMADRLRESNGKLTPDMIQEVTDLVGIRGQALHKETTDGVKLMMQFLKDSDSEELVEGVLDVFKVSNKIHNFKDFDAWMRQKIMGGEFNGKVKTGAMIHELQGVMVNSILSGPKTPMRAIFGTTTNAYLNAINEYAGALVRSPFADDVISRKASLAKLKGMFELVPEAWQVFKEHWNSKFTADFANIRTRYSEAPTRADYNWNLFGQWTERNGTAGDKAAYYLANVGRTLNNNKLLSWSPRAMAATDDTFKWLLARVRSKEVGMRQAFEATGENWAKMTPELMKAAEDIHFKNLHDADGNINLSKDSWLNKQFKEVTLTSELNGFAKKLDGLLNETPLLKPFYLFARTGINGLNLSYKNTPLLGALHKESIAILTHKGNDFTPLMKYGIENANDLANAKNLFAGRQAVGATVVSGMASMYIAGQLTGNGPADRQLRQQWINAGWKPNHFYIGNVGFDYSSLEPFNVMFSAIADIGDNLELMGSQWAEKRLQAAAFVIGRGLTGKTYMSGLDQLMQVMQMKPGALDKAGANILNNSVPLAGMRNEFGKWINPHMKELNGDIWDSLRNRNQMSELVAQKPLPAKHDMLNGTPIKNWNIIGRSFNAISPVQLDIRRDTPGRRFLMESNYDLKSTTYAYNGYSFQKFPNVRSHFQNAIGTVPITFRGRTFKNLEATLDYISTLPDVKNSMGAMNSAKNNPSKWNIDPNSYPHNTIIDRVIQQARAKAWAKINDPSHPGFTDLQEAKGENDGLDTQTRDNRQEILDLSFPQEQFERFPKLRK